MSAAVGFRRNPANTASARGGNALKRLPSSKPLHIYVQYFFLNLQPLSLNSKPQAPLHKPQSPLLDLSLLRVEEFAHGQCQSSHGRDRLFRRLEEREFFGVSSSSLLLSSLELSDAKVYEPCIRARVGTSAHFYEHLS